MELTKIQHLLYELKRHRERINMDRSELAVQLQMGSDWVEAVEEGEVIPSLEMVFVIADIVKADLSEIFKYDNDASSLPLTSLSRPIFAIQQGSDVLLTFQYNDHLAKYIIQNAILSDYEHLLTLFRSGSYNSGKKSDYVINTFFNAIKLWPNINPTDIWGFLISRIYQDPHNHPVTERHRDFAQSWKRTSGWVLERIFVKFYQDWLLQNGIIIDTFTKSEVKEYIDSMELDYHDVKEKADVLLVDRDSNVCFGVVHVKASIAERRQADQSFSQALLSKNYFSPFVTLDCKSVPSPMPIHKGEFGLPTSKDFISSSNKRMDFEKQGYFSACYSYNTNTIPTPTGQKAASRILSLNFQNPDDSFSKAAIEARDRLFGG